MRQIYILILTATYLLFVGCSSPLPTPVKVEPSQKKIDYLAEVKPILDSRCVSCHSCYNSPCQAKFSSYEGIDRGGSKALVYDALRLSAIDPTRLFTDAKDTDEWRKKDFFSLTDSPDSNITHNDSIMMHMLEDKRKNPEVIGEYAPEEEKWMCPRNSEEMGEYLEEKPNHGMPYGLPALKADEHKTLAQWLQQGAHGPTDEEQKELTSPSIEAKVEIERWETFLNDPDPKHAVTARYLYEHYYLAHINFKTAPDEFYELVRSSAPKPRPIETIPTLRPFDDPGSAFTYRFRRIHSTIVHKTHMVLEFDDAKLKRLNELFIEPTWMERPHLVSYDTKTSANPFVAFFQIPVRSRYQFLLDHSHYIVMTFIRGPVCRGQMALNVIHDHFWVMFQDPEHDISVQQPGFLMRQASNLQMPIETNDRAVWKTFSDKYRKKYGAYFDAKQKLYDVAYPDGLGLEGIWKGETAKDAPLLTVYRHFNSASVQRGVVGELPRTAWVIDYPQFERIYYALVAGYDIYGNVSHQTNIRRYMDFLRIEGEANFISYMPEERRLPMFKSWYIGDSEMQALDKRLMFRGTKIEYSSQHPRGEFIEQVVNEHILKETKIGFDDINYYSEGQVPPKMPERFESVEDLKDGARSLTAPGTGFMTHIVDHGINLMHLRIIIPGEEDYVTSLVVNRWHDNVNSLFNGEEQRDSTKDTIDFVPYSIGSYPNAFGQIHYDDLPDFFDLIANFDGSDVYIAKIRKYFINRADEDFWETYDWFQEHLDNADPLQAGLYDLNRYYRQGR